MTDRRLLNTDQRAPASASWPESRGGFRIGQRVKVRNAGGGFIHGHITRFVDQSLFEIRTPSGALVKAGMRVVEAADE